VPQDLEFFRPGPRTDLSDAAEASQVLEFDFVRMLNSPPRHELIEDPKHAPAVPSGSLADVLMCFMIGGDRAADLPRMAPAAAALHELEATRLCT
jgi:hypothetical protein